ncbi:1-deoxy-D-xylulose-5-phosphate synthase [Phaeacidiphilus oryzae]|uniref:1-deoxy-D-xylulose-5-phosphate synthase n=1 Tax=Phaeacidiphilus oryzae TaxID=348818 RepID=UPI000A017F10|nr:1-deoxy-D-xylulose-5-phosphate synthase [Phaeacidiphilus oryzae]
MSLLPAITGPKDLRALPADRLPDLAEEIRSFLISEVAKTGGHLGPNLGVVELTIALHRVFESPQDRILFDTGHQCYVHKLLTGRQDFSRLKKSGGLSGYPSRAESEHDVIENSHASTVLGYADGLAKANKLRGRTDRAVVAVIGDGALTGGMAWEAINNIAEAEDRPVVIVVNDNERSYSPTIGGLADHLATLRTSRGYERFLSWGKEQLQRTPLLGGPLYDALHGAKKGYKDAVTPQGMFEDLGLKYVGPVDGHDEQAVESALRRAKGFGGPVIVHCITEKGRGYRPAEEDQADHFHQVGAIDPETGKPLSASSGTSWTSVLGGELLALAREREDIVALTAAMPGPLGLTRFAEEFPDRFYDVGIAEQHATVSAAGLATGGLHPVFAVYSTFLNRAFDQVLMDVALHRLGVTFVLDRAGTTGSDGPSHNGMWDLSILRVVPGLRIAAPRDADQLRAELREAVEVDDAPTVLRYPKATVGPAIPAIDRVGGVDVLARTAAPAKASASGSAPADGLDADVLLVAVGTTAEACLDAAERLAVDGVGCTVVDPRWVKPVDPAIPELAARHRMVVTVEDSGRASGTGAAVAQAIRDAGVRTPARDLGLPQEFLIHASRNEILEQAGLTGPGIASATADLLREQRRAAAGRAAARKRAAARRSARAETLARSAAAAPIEEGDPSRGI